MNEIQIFKNEEFGEIRTLEINGQPYFVGVDVSNALGYKDAHKALKLHVDEQDWVKCPLLSNGGIQQTITINESGLYSLIMSSKLPDAKAFKRWVTAEVLPSIRHTGAYGNLTFDKVFSKELEEKIEDIVRKVADEKISALKEDISALEKKIDSLEKKSEKIASDTCVTLRPAFIQLHEKLNDINKKTEKLSANIASEISRRLRPQFRSLETKIKGFIKSSDRKSESISKAVSDNTKLVAAYLNALANIFKL